MKFSAKKESGIEIPKKINLELVLVLIGSLFSIWVPLNWFHARPEEFQFMWGGGGDGFLAYAFVDSLATGNFPINFRFGFPEGLNWGYYPNGDWMLTIPAAILSKFFGLGVGVVSVYILSFPLCFLFSYFLARELKLGLGYSVNLALIFTFLPWHFGRLGHVMLATQFAVASGLLLLIRVFITNKLQNIRQLLIISLLVLVSSLSGIYFALFTSLMFGTSLIWKSFQEGVIRQGKHFFLFLVFNGVTVLGQVPFRLAIPEGLDPLIATRRLVWESYLYGGRLIYAIVPNPNTGISPLRGVLNPIRQLPVDTESGLPSNYGTLAVTFFSFVLLFYVFYMLSRKRVENLRTEKQEQAVKYLLLLLILVILMFITFGPNLLFAYFVSPQIRAWNRMTPLLQLLIVLIGSIVMSQWTSQQKYLKKLLASKVTSRLSIFFFTTIILVDQTNGIGSMRGLVDQGIQRQTMAANYNLAIDSSVPENCPVFQLPIVGFPEVGPIARFQEYEHFLPALVSEKRAWSYGAVKNTSAARFSAELLGKSPKELVKNLKDEGFCILHLDIRGYESDKIKSQLQNILGEPIATGFDGNWFAFKIS